MSIDPNNDILRSAVIKLEQKILPSKIPDTTESAKMEPFTALYPMLEIWDEGRADPDNQEKTRVIYDFLSAKGSNTKDTLIGIFTKLGATPPTETKLGRIYRYCKLHNEGAKTMRYYETIQKDINAISTP